jgi:short-subunit dehydrogenase
MTNKQTILIAGATGNIGGGAAVTLAKRGARVVLLGHSADKLKAKVDLVRVASSEARIDYQDRDIDMLVVTLTCW